MPINPNTAKTTAPMLYVPFVFAKTCAQGTLDHIFDIVVLLRCALNQPISAPQIPKETIIKPLTETLKETFIPNITANSNPIIPAIASTLSTPAIITQLPTPPAVTPTSEFTNQAIQLVQQACQIVQNNQQLQAILFTFCMMGAAYFNRGTTIRNINIKVEADAAKERNYTIVTDNKSKLSIKLIPNESPKISIEREKNATKESTVYNITIVENLKSPISKEQKSKPIEIDLGNEQVISISDLRSYKTRFPISQAQRKINQEIRAFDPNSLRRQL